MVGLWGGWQTITEAQRKDMEDSQHKRGLKVIATSLFDGFEMGVAPDGATAATEEEMLAYWGWEGPYRSYGNDNLTEGNIAAIQRFAHAFCQRIIDNGYDGLDIDNEPNIGTGKETLRHIGLPQPLQSLHGCRSHLFRPHFGHGTHTGHRRRAERQHAPRIRQVFRLLHLAGVRMQRRFEPRRTSAELCQLLLGGSVQGRCPQVYRHRKFREHHLPHQRRCQLHEPATASR